jgi:RecA-family ATPase
MKHDIVETLRAIDPARLSYQEWLEVGMALRHEGYDCHVWDSWSARDAARYRPGECEKKWRGFAGSGITGGTVVALAFDHGWSPARDPSESREIDWDGALGADGIISPAWTEDVEIADPGDSWDPVKDLVTYLSALFGSDDLVGYVTQSYKKDDRFLPSRGAWDRTAGELIEKLSGCGGDIGSVLGDYNPDAGAWIRFNPLDGDGVGNDNVTEFRFALVECDDLPIEKQNALIREMELPVAALVHSGKKSLHAIVRINAKDYAEYRKRVDYLYKACLKSGLAVDTQNRNPSRMSRMPGVTRGGARQHLVATEIGRKSWEAWEEWWEESQDVFPDIMPFDAESGLELPEPHEVIRGILSQGDKMMVSGPSKAGKTFALLELAVAIAEGGHWLGHWCGQCTVLYINLELKKESRIRRLNSIYEALGTPGANAGRIHCLDLRGQSAPIDKLAGKIIRSCAKIKPSAIIIDPIYKIMTGDENSASDVGRFCNALDGLCASTGAAAIYCHHHSKGSQGAKFSIDRASGSGVFARDVDALLDLTELHVTDDMRDALGGDAGMSAWAVEATLREYAKPKTRYVTFRHPLHVVDDTGVLEDAQTEDGWKSVKSAREKQESFGRRGADATSDKAATRRSLQRDAVMAAIRELKANGTAPTQKSIAAHIGEFEGKTISWKTIDNWRDKWEEYREATTRVDKENGNVLEITLLTEIY